MSHVELPLVLFTVLSQLAIGLVLMSAFRGETAHGPGLEPESGRAEWLTAFGVLLVSLIASTFHLGHPMGAPNALKHLSSAWLSREALVFGILLVLMLATALLGRSKPLAVFTAVVGLVGLLVQGMTYAPPSFPALNNGLPFVFFVVYAVVLGAGFGSYFAPEEKQGLLRTTLLIGLIVGLVVFLVAPCLWLSGGTIMEQTAKGWLSSPFYWAHIGLGLALPLVALIASRIIPAWLPALLLIGAFCGRVVFYLETVHAATNMGGLY